MVDIISKYTLNISFVLLRGRLKTLLLCWVWLNLVLWFPFGRGQGEIAGRTSWQRLETRYTVVLYESLEDLERFNDNIEYSKGGGVFKSLFSGSKDPVASVKKKVDAVFERVQEILDMRGIIQKIVIKIYPNRKRFNEVRYNVTGKERSIRAWYIYEQNTIYINADDVHEGILAHEIAHAIIDHYLTVRPPKATAEILARYVDKHLHF